MLGAKYATWEIAIPGTGIEWDMMLLWRYTSCLGGILLSRFFSGTMLTWKMETAMPFCISDAFALQCSLKGHSYLKAVLVCRFGTMPLYFALPAHRLDKVSRSAGEDATSRSGR